MIPYPIENYVYMLDPEICKKFILDLIDLIKYAGKGANNFEEFLLGRFGKTLYELYFQPYNYKVWRRELSNVPLSWLEGKLPMPTLKEMIYNNMTVTEGKIKDIPYMLGSTADDIGVFPEMKEKGEHGGIYKGCINWSLALEKLGRKPAYVYYFTRALLGDDAGAFHSSELWYMFGTLGRSWRPKTEGDYALSKEMMDDWTNFMKTGNPNAEGKDDWKPCTKDDPYVQVLDVRK